MRAVSKKSTYVLFFLFCLVSFAGCSERPLSIYDGLGTDEDGTLAVEIPDEAIQDIDDDVADEIKDEINDDDFNKDPGDQAGANDPESEHKKRADVLSSIEQGLVDDLHEGENGNLSFLVVDVERSLVLRSYLASRPRRLASVSKVPTALAALEEVRNVNIAKIARMLKTSNNGEASRYVRLAGKAIDGHITSGASYSQGASCPSAYRNDRAAAKIVERWMFQQASGLDWTGASLNDGAGCDYGNFMNGLQIASILEFADSRGKAYDGRSFEELLSINGVDGSWRSRNPESRGQIFAKTGTLRPNSNLAGFFYARRNGVLKKYYFVVFVEKKGAGSYTTRARSLIESLLKYWISYYSQTPGESIENF
jgi:D-alanyl-D-alanine carboxypeptidase